MPDAYMRHTTGCPPKSPIIGTLERTNTLQLSIPRDVTNTQ